MKRLALGIALQLITAFSLVAQQTSDVHQYTALPANARYEIVQSELAARWTFRLDRFTGHVAQLVDTKDGEDAWEEMEVIGMKPITTSLHAHFQIFTSGIAARHTFLIDTDSGKTWVVVSDKGTNSDGTEYENDMWQPFAIDK